MAAKFITAQDIVTICLAEANFDQALIKDAYIYSAQEQYMRPVLGDELYNEMCEEAATSIAGLSVLNAELLAQYKDALAFWCLLIGLPNFMAHITSAGVQLNNTEYSQPVSSAQRAEIMENTKTIATSFENKFLRWINGDYSATQKRYELYPLYKANPNNSTGKIIGGILI